MKIVLDTNVLVAGLLSPFGPCAQIVRMVSSGDLMLCFDARILSEYDEVLRRPKFQFREDRVAALLDYADQTLDVLAAAHAANVIHRDLKPDNVFVMNDGRVKVLDFGIARIIDGVPREYRTRTGMTMGTLPFMPIEQALGRHAEVDGRTDLYALGALMFRLLSGRNVFQARGEAALLLAMTTERPTSLAASAPESARSVRSGPAARRISRASCVGRRERPPGARP